MTDDELRAMIEAATPGPWGANFDDAILIKAKRNTVASIRIVDLFRRAPMPEVTANARLIAAAPDLAAEVLRMRAALRYYASESLWDRDGGNDGMTPMERDGGKRARAALCDNA
jgi:hypothetical protein